MLSSIEEVVKIIKESDNKVFFGGARVLYVNFVKLETIYLITVYAKNEQENITKSEKAEFKTLIKELEEEVKKSR